MMAKSTHFNPSRVKPFLLHEDSLVRRNVAAYLRESLSRDKELIPLITKACRDYGETGNLAGLQASRYFRQSYPSVTLVLELLEQTGDGPLASALNGILAAMSAPIFFLTQGKLMRAPRVLPSTLNRLHQRLGVWNRSPARLVSSFERFVGEARDEDELFSVTQRTLADDLVDALVPHDEPSSTYLIERLAGCTTRGDSGALYIIDLLGKRRVRSAIPALIECFTIDSEHFSRRAAEALIRIGDEAAIEQLRKRIPYEGNGFKKRAAKTLIGFKHLESELLLLDLLDFERDLTLRAMYCEGLCCHYAIRGHTLILRQITLSAPEIARRLKLGLLVTSIIRGRALPDAEAWREEIEAGYAGSEDVLLEPAWVGAQSHRPLAPSTNA